jgi:CHAT domain-containing protein
MDDLIERLLACSDERERRAILEAHRDTLSPLDLVTALKARADAYLRDEPARARHVANVATTVAAWWGQPQAQAVAAWARANARYFQGYFLECLALYEEALAFFEQAGDPLIIARLQTNCSAVLCHLGRYFEALAYLESARAILTPHGASANLAGLEMNLAMVYQQLDRYSEAVAACERGRAVALAIGDRARAARLDVNRAVALEGLGRFQEAIDLLLTTVRVLEAEEEQLEAARAYLNLGWLRFHIGHYRQALMDLEVARHRFAELDNEMEVATADLHRAQVYLQLNLLPEVIELCQSAQAAFLSDRGVLRYAALAEYYAGVAYGRLGERELALQHLTAARERMAALDLPVQAALIDLERASLLLGQLTLTPLDSDMARPAPEHITEAQTLAQAACDVFEARGLALKVAWAQIVLADAQHGLGDLEAARVAYTRALSTLEDVGPAELRYRAWHGLGRLVEATGRHAEAIAHYRRAIKAVTATAAALGESELRAGFLHDKLDAFQAAVSLSLGAGWTEEALQLVELARVGGWMPPPDEAATAPDANAEAQRLLAEVARLRETWHWQHSRLRPGDAGVEPPAEQDPAREMHAWKELRAVERRLADAVRTLRLHLGQARSLAQPAPVTPVNVEAHLVEGQCLLAYYVARGQIIAFVVHRAGFAVVPLSVAWTAVIRRMDRLRFSLHCQGSDTLHHLQWLWRVLLTPLASHLADCRQLIVVPHDRLHYLPFHALHDGTGYLLERCQVTYLPAVSLLTWGDPRAISLQSPLALILACSDHGRLPGTLAEGRAIHAALTSSSTSSRDIPTPLLRLDAEATSVCLRQHAPDCTLLHIAAHSRFRHDNPLFSALHLGDGPLLLADLDDLWLPGAPLVVLSACETGLGDLRGSDVLGLSRAFLRAGARAILVSLWRVPDEATARLMETFYQRLARGTAPAEALRQAQRGLLAETGYAHPRQWAGWVLVGNQATMGL